MHPLNYPKQKDMGKKGRKVLIVLHIIARYFLASVMIMYAAAKILGTQFEASPWTYDVPIGELSGFHLTWFYYSYSFPYGLFIAGAQTAASLFLFFRKTIRLGISIYLGLILNILLIDFAYDIEGAKGMAILLTVVALFVFLVDYKPFCDFFLTQPKIYESRDVPSWTFKLKKVKYFYIPIIVIGVFSMFYYLKVNFMGKNDFYGSWQPQNHKDWSRIYIQEGHTFSVRTGDELTEKYKGKYYFNEDAKEIEFIGINKLSKNKDSIVVIKGKYELTDKNLSIINDTLVLESIRLR